MVAQELPVIWCLTPFSKVRAQAGSRSIKYKVILFPWERRLPAGLCSAWRQCGVRPHFLSQRTMTARCNEYREIWCLTPILGCQRR